MPCSCSFAWTKAGLLSRGCPGSWLGLGSGRISKSPSRTLPEVVGSAASHCLPAFGGLCWISADPPGLWRVCLVPKSITTLLLGLFFFNPSLLLKCYWNLKPKASESITESCTPHSGLGHLLCPPAPPLWCHRINRTSVCFHCWWGFNNWTAAVAWHLGLFIIN